MYVSAWGPSPSVWMKPLQNDLLKSQNLDNKIIQLTKNIKLNMNISHLMHLLPPSIVNAFYFYDKNFNYVTKTKESKLCQVSGYSVVVNLFRSICLLNRGATLLNLLR